MRRARTGQRSAVLCSAHLLARGRCHHVCWVDADELGGQPRQGLLDPAVDGRRLGQQPVQHLDATLCGGTHSTWAGCGVGVSGVTSGRRKPRASGSSRCGTYMCPAQAQRLGKIRGGLEQGARAKGRHERERRMRAACSCWIRPAGHVAQPPCACRLVGQAIVWARLAPDMLPGPPACTPAAPP